MKPIDRTLGDFPLNVPSSLPRFVSAVHHQQEICQSHKSSASRPRCITPIVSMTTNSNVRSCYDRVAGEYARKFFHEFDHKPCDRMLLKRFHEETRGRGVVCDLGCGPGEVAAFLHGLGSNAVGIDFSEGMIEQARRLSPDISFICDDMFHLSIRDDELAGIAAFYAIVHSSLDDLRRAFVEWHRVLQPQGMLLLSFHIGAEVIHLEELLGIQVPIDFVFFEPDAIVHELRNAGFTILDVLIRYPYEDVEYPSRRCYILSAK